AAVARQYHPGKANEIYTMGGTGFGSGSTVVIQGTGPMGLLHVLKAHIMGAGRIIALDRSPARLALAQEFGADHGIPVSTTTPAERVAMVRDLTDGRG